MVPLEYDNVPLTYFVSKTISCLPSELFELPVKFAGIAIPNPITLAGNNHKDSTLVVSHLIQALLGCKIFSIMKHSDTQASVL
jgi:hypothetical protein